MGHIYLADYIELPPRFAPMRNLFKPRGFDQQNAASIDLRGDSTKVEGKVLVSVPERNDTEIGLDYLGENFDETISVSRKNRLANKLGLQIDQLSVRGIIEDIMFSGDDKDPKRHNALRPSGNKYEIYLDGLVSERPAGRGGAVYLDPFTRADNANVSTGAPYPWTSSTGAASIQSNRWNIVDNGAGVYYRMEQDVTSTDMYALCKIVTNTNISGDNYMGPVARYASAAQTGYEWFSGKGAGGFSNGLHSLYSMIAASETQVLAETAYTWVTNDIFKVQCTGTSIACTINGSHRSGSPVTNSAITTGVRGGLFGFKGNASNDVEMDDFEIFPAAIPATFKKQAVVLVRV